VRETINKLCFYYGLSALRFNLTSYKYFRDEKEGIRLFYFMAVIRKYEFLQVILFHVWNFPIFEYFFLCWAFYFGCFTFLYILKRGHVTYHAHDSNLQMQFEIFLRKSILCRPHQQVLSSDRQIFVCPHTHVTSRIQSMRRYPQPEASR
jgi:hypothetical protein